MHIRLSDHFTVHKLLRFSFPSVLMMIFTSVYGVVDGWFVSNYVGKAPFAAVNFIMPFLMILGAAGSMLGTGGSALVARTLGEGRREMANRLFSLFVLATAVMGIGCVATGYIILRPVATFLGAEGDLLENAVLYGRYVLPAMPAFMLQYEFQSFFVTAEKPRMGLYTAIAAGVTNMALDALLVAVFPLGLRGAAIATTVSMMVGGLLPVAYFVRPGTALLRLTGTSFDGRALWKACTNGASEFVSNVSMSMVGMLYNYQLIRYAGENGVAAYGVLMYVNMIFLAVFLGYAEGTAPVVGFHFGAGHSDELSGLLRKSIRILAGFSLLMFLAGEIFAGPLSDLFTGYDTELKDLTLRAFRVYSLSFLFVGVPIYGSSFFTALNDGLVSAAISFLRTVVFESAAVLILPLLWGIDGIWLSTVVVEMIAAALTGYFWRQNAGKYGY